MNKSDTLLFNFLILCIVVSAYKNITFATFICSPSLIYIRIIAMVKFTLEMLKAKCRPSAIPISAAFLNRDVSDSALVSELIHRGSGYLVIPASKHPILFDYETILINLLTNNYNKLKNMLVDITLPFFYNGPVADRGLYFGRYLIFDRKIIGIRLNCSSKMTGEAESDNYKRWHSGKWANWTLTPRLQDCYNDLGMDPNEIRMDVKVGDFFVAFRNARIYPVF